MNKEVLTTEEAAELLKISRSVMYKLLADGKGPPSFRVGRHRRFLREDLLAWMKANAH